MKLKFIKKGLFNKNSTAYCRKSPSTVTLNLDEFGTYIWRQIDGVRSIYDIGQLVKQHFGEKAEPLYERLCQFTKILHKNQFIVYTNKIKQK